ncbi:MAG: DUF3662 domain-containing protein, partial [Microbacterium sp.]|nr:DUF3662 domain-containing protein [Microbacterium sp.]
MKPARLPIPPLARDRVSPTQPPEDITRPGGARTRPDAPQRTNSRSAQPVQLACTHWSACRRSRVGLLDSFEKGLERAVNGAFARTFRSGIQPVEIAS